MSLEAVCDGDWLYPKLEDARRTHFSVRSPDQCYLPGKPKDSSELSGRNWRSMTLKTVLATADLGSQFLLADDRIPALGKAQKR
jgi:hypothetical protein